MASLEQIISFVKGDKTSISHPLKVLLFEMINVTAKTVCIHRHYRYRYCYPYTSYDGRISF